MAMKRRGGTKGKPIVERMLNVFDLHFPTSAVKAMSRICACKTERNLLILGWCLQFKQSCQCATLSYFCLQNKAGKINATGRVVLRKCIKRAQCYLFALKCEEVPLKIEFTTFAAKKPQPLCETWNEKGILGTLQLLPFLIPCPYHRPVCYPAHGHTYRGVSKQLPLTQIIGINFAINPSCFSFPSLLLSRTFFATSFAVLFFCQTKIQEIFSPALFFVTIFHFS